MKRLHWLVRIATGVFGVCTYVSVFTGHYVMGLISLGLLVGALFTIRTLKKHSHLL